MTLVPRSALIAQPCSLNHLMSKSLTNSRHSSLRSQKNKKILKEKEILPSLFLSDMAKKSRQRRASLASTAASLRRQQNEGKETLKDTLLLSFLHRSSSQILISCVSARQEAYHVQSGGGSEQRGHGSKPLSIIMLHDCWESWK